MRVETRSNSYTHAYWTDEYGDHFYCSEAVEWDHYGQPGTGFGWCPHGDDSDDEPAETDMTRMRR